MSEATQTVAAELQHLPEITVPEIEIDRGWPVSDVLTIEDCDDAFASLMAAIAEIEYELELKTLGVCKFADPTWPARARRALKYKRAALQLVGFKRGQINDDNRRNAQAIRDRALLDHIKQAAGPAQFHQWVVGFTATHNDAAEAA